MNREKRRFAQISIPISIIAKMFSGEKGIYEIRSKIPVDAKLSRTWLDQQTNTLHLAYEHDSFSLSDEGNPIPGVGDGCNMFDIKSRSNDESLLMRVDDPGDLTQRP